jgi:REP element-mobilizing transposase RayT
MLLELNAYKSRSRTDREYQFWQEGSHPEQILGAEMMVQKIDYTHYNPVKRGYVDEPIHWRYSSARNYAGMPGLLDVTLFSL